MAYIISRASHINETTADVMAEILGAALLFQSSVRGITISFGRNGYVGTDREREQQQQQTEEQERENVCVCVCVCVCKHRDSIE